MKKENNTKAPYTDHMLQVADTIQAKVEAYRDEKKIKQNEFFGPDGCNVSQQSWIQWRRGRKIPSGEAIIRICEYTGMTPNELLGYAPESGDKPALDDVTVDDLLKMYLYRRLYGESISLPSADNG